MHYEINISLNGRHFFATESRSIQNERELLKVFPVLSEKFPEAEGYTLDVTCYPGLGYGCSRERLKKFIDKGDLSSCFKF